jgi:hypothetical protein
MNNVFDWDDVEDAFHHRKDCRFDVEFGPGGTSLVGGIKAGRLHGTVVSRAVNGKIWEIVPSYFPYDGEKRFPDIGVNTWNFAIHDVRWWKFDDDGEMTHQYDVSEKNMLVTERGYRKRKLRSVRTYRFSYDGAGTVIYGSRVLDPVLKNATMEDFARVINFVRTGDWIIPPEEMEEKYDVFSYTHPNIWRPSDPITAVSEVDGKYVYTTMFSERTITFDPQKKELRTFLDTSIRLRARLRRLFKDIKTQSIN